MPGAIPKKRLLVNVFLLVAGIVRRAWREGKWLEYGFTIALWVAAVAFVWFVMDVPGLWGRLMEYVCPQSAPLAALCSLLFIFWGFFFSASSRAFARGRSARFCETCFLAAQGGTFCVAKGRLSGGER